MAFAAILEQVGSTGRFQVIHVLLLAFPLLFMPSHNLLQNFVAAVPDHRCRLSASHNLSASLNATGRLLPRDLVLLMVPFDRQGRADKCRLYTAPQWGLLWPNDTRGNGSKGEMQPCTDGWEYDRSQFTSTIVTEWDLVCEHKSLKRVAQSIYMAGLLIGAIVLGRLSDKYGRRTLLLWSYFQLAASGTCAAFSTSFPLFCFWRFLSGVAVSGVILNSFSLKVEWIPTRMRTPISMISNFLYTFGQLFLSGLAYAVQDWRWLQLTISLPFFVFFLYAWWFAESARWLIVNGKTDVALKQLKRVARMNGKAAEADKLTVEILNASMDNDQADAQKQRVVDLFRTPVMRRIACCTMVVWFSTSFAYYGLAIDLQGFGVNIYLIQLIFGAVDLPAKVVAFLTLSLVGRRFTQSSSLILAGSTLLVNAFIPREMQTVRTSLAAFGKAFLSAAFSCCYLYSGELYPTVVRQTGMGMVSTMARFGSMMAPIIRMSGDYIAILPHTCYGGLAVAAGITAAFLPETLNIPLPETIEDVEKRSVSQRGKRALAKDKASDKEEVPLQEARVSLMTQTVPYNVHKDFCKPMNKRQVGTFQSMVEHEINKGMSEHSSTMAFGDLLEMVGGLGRYQVVHVLLLTFPLVFMASHNLLQNFVAAVPDHRCRLSASHNLSASLNATGRLLPRDLVRLLVPVDRQGREDKCRLYAAPQWGLLWPNDTRGNGSEGKTQPCTDGWEYDRSQFTSTIVTEWDLVCEHKSLKRVAQSIYMAGLLIGAIVLGRLSDKFGRRSLLLWSSLQLAASGTCGMFSSSFAFFCFWRFLCGVAASGVISNTYSVAVEWVPTQIRAAVMTGINYGYVFGQLLWAGEAFLIRDWRWLQFVVSLPYFVIFLYSWWFSESARWLIMNQKADAALKELRRVARINGRQEEGERLTIEIIKANMEDELSDAKDSYGILDLFRTPEMRRITWCTMIVWFATSFSYYGLSIDLQGFGMDIYLIQVIFGAVDIPAKFIGFILMSHIGRRFTQSATLIAAGCIIVANIFLPPEMQTVRMLLNAVGKGCLAAAFSCLFLHSAELYPTVVRQTGMGLAYSMARIGAIVAPIVRLVGDYVPFLPMATYGGIAIVSGLAACSLPETLNLPLPDTIEEVERRYVLSTSHYDRGLHSQTHGLENAHPCTDQPNTSRPPA
ncbi:uncharacterized protein LOC144609622 [Rhinoraja longicauda]